MSPVPWTCYAYAAACEHGAQQLGQISSPQFDNPQLLSQGLRVIKTWNACGEIIELDMRMQPHVRIARNHLAT